MSDLTDDERQLANAGLTGARYAEWRKEGEAIARGMVEQALREQREQIAAAIEALPCPGSPPLPLARYAYETARAHAARIVREWGAR